jgi:uncharacterized protein YjbJ (UPF0337 family)
MDVWEMGFVCTHGSTQLTYSVGTVADDLVSSRGARSNNRGGPSRIHGADQAPEREERPMSAIDKIKNKAEELVGDAKEAVGKATDNEQLQAEGQADQASANTKQTGEKVKDVFK